MIAANSFEKRATKRCALPGVSSAAAPFRPARGQRRKFPSLRDRCAPYRRRTAWSLRRRILSTRAISTVRRPVPSFELSIASSPPTVIAFTLVLLDGT